MHCTTCFRPENKCIGSIMRLKEVYYKILDLHFFMIQTRNVLPPGVVLSLGPFCPWEVLSLGTFCPFDVLSFGTFYPLGRDVHETFCLGTFCMWFHSKSYALMSAGSRLWGVRLLSLHVTTRQRQAPLYGQENPQKLKLCRVKDTTRNQVLRQAGQCKAGLRSGQNIVEFDSAVGRTLM